MRIRIAFIAAALLLASCSDDYVSPVSTPDKKVGLTVTLNDTETKAYVEAGSTEESTLHNVQVLVFNKDNVLETSSDLLTSSMDRIDLEVIPGNKTIWVLGNVPSKVSPASLNDLLAINYALGDNSLNKFIMSGYEHVEVTDASSVEIALERLASKVAIDKIERRFTDGRYSEIPLEIKNIYISNASSHTNVVASGTTVGHYNLKGVIDDDLPSGAADLIYDYDINTVLNEGGDYTTPHTFYVYPNNVMDDHPGSGNNGDKKTRLVVECLYNGSPCYYPITLPPYHPDLNNPLTRNTSYHITKLVLKRPGSPDPDNPGDEVDSTVDFSFYITVAPWGRHFTYEETFN